MVAVGLTGDIGAGKSTLCKLWSELGATVIDADAIARALWRDSAVMEKAKKRWGETFFDCEDMELYAKIADKIFTDDAEYQFAGKLIYPRVICKIKSILKKIPQSGWAVAEIPLLFECNCEQLFDVTVYVAATLDKRTERNIVRNLNKDELKRRQAKFMSRKLRMQRADFVLRNSGTEEEWRKKCERLAKRILKSEIKKG